MWVMSLFSPKVYILNSYIAELSTDFILAALYGFYFLQANDALFLNFFFFHPAISFYTLKNSDFFFIL